MMRSCSVTREFIAKVKEEALGQEVMTQLSPGQAFVEIVYDELTKYVVQHVQGGMALGHRVFHPYPGI